MLRREELLNGMDRKYHKMLNEVNIPDFTKTVWAWAQEREVVSDEVICEYLQTWATNKYPLYEMIGGTRKDIKIEFEPQISEGDNFSQYLQLAKDYPAYAPWLISAPDAVDKDGKVRDRYYSFNDYAEKTFPGSRSDVAGMKVTGFFSKFLKAPEDLVTGIAAIYEFKKIKGTYTLSIDPVDIMLASENPYDWRSCYALDGEYADGLMASILDPKIAIGYIWEREGEHVIGRNTYKLKSIRYKRMRQWVMLGDNYANFCKMYPSKDNVSKSLQEEVYRIVGNIINPEVTWEKRRINVSRYYAYGYDEFYAMIGIREINSEVERWHDEPVYTVEIKCPCGCGSILPDRNEDDNRHIRHNGDGFICSNFYEEEEYYCEICDTYYYEGEDCECQYCDDCGARIHPSEYDENEGLCNDCYKEQNEEEEVVDVD